MNFKIFALMLLSVFLLVSLVSAVDVYPAEISGNSPTLNTGDSFDVKFKINNSDITKNVTNIAVSYTDSQTAQFLQLTSAKLGSTAYPVITSTITSDENALVYSAALTNVKVLNGSLSDLITLTFRAGGQAPVGVSTKNIIINAKHEDGTSVSIESVRLTPTINPNPSLSITKIKDLSRTQNGTINITNSGNIRLSNIVLSSAGNFGVSLSQSGVFSLNPGESRNVEVTASDLSTLKFGINSATISAVANNNVGAQYSFSIAESFCRSGTIGSNLSLRDVAIRSDGEDDAIWKPLDTITVKVEVENLASDNIGSIYVDLGLFDSNGKNVAKDLNFISKDDENVKLGSINDGESKKTIFEFKAPADIKEGNYRLAVKAYSKESGLGEDKLCIDNAGDLSNTIYEVIRIEKQDAAGKFIAFDKIETSPSELICGDKGVLSFDVLNIGTEDQDRIKVMLLNKELGISMFEEIKNGLDMGDSQAMSFSFGVPATASNKTYNLELSAEYDYNDGTYREISEDLFTVPLKVICLSKASSITGRAALITASLESDATAGKQMAINSKISNVGANSASFIIGAKNYESWATLDSISERVFTLAPGESKTLVIILSVNKDASGEKSFVIEALADGKSETREVAVNIAGESASSLSSYFKNNYLIWIIGAVNLLLIILIIFVAIRVSRR
ncbi:MAG: putative S-layer protein [Nanoarchaeota archaeon]